MKLLCVIIILSQFGEVLIHRPTQYFYTMDLHATNKCQKIQLSSKRERTVLAKMHRRTEQNIFYVNVL